MALATTQSRSHGGERCVRTIAVDQAADVDRAVVPAVLALAPNSGDTIDTREKAERRRVAHARRSKKGSLRAEPPRVSFASRTPDNALFAPGNAATVLVLALWTAGLASSALGREQSAPLKAVDIAVRLRVAREDAAIHRRETSHAVEDSFVNHLLLAERRQRGGYHARLESRVTLPAPQEHAQCLLSSRKGTRRIGAFDFSD